MDVGAWVGLGLLALLALGSLIALAVRTWVIAAVNRRVDAKFERELEAVRSDLRLKEGKINALQANVLSGHAGRQALLDKRRLQAIETLWPSVLRLDEFKISATMMTMLKINAVEKRAQTDAKLREFLSGFSSGDLRERLTSIGGEIERLFVPVSVWMVFEAYRNLLVYCFVRLKSAAYGIPDTENMWDEDTVFKAIKSVMPHVAQHIDKHGISAAAHLADPLRDLLIKSLRASLISSESDEQILKEIMESMKKLDASLEEKTDG
jgi:hypothetical protein